MLQKCLKKNKLQVQALCMKALHKKKEINIKVLPNYKTVGLNNDSISSLNSDCDRMEMAGAVHCLKVIGRLTRGPWQVKHDTKGGMIWGERNTITSDHHWLDHGDWKAWHVEAPVPSPPGTQLKITLKRNKKHRQSRPSCDAERTILLLVHPLHERVGDKWWGWRGFI